MPRLRTTAFWLLGLCNVALMGLMVAWADGDFYAQPLFHNPSLQIKLLSAAGGLYALAMLLVPRKGVSLGHGKGPNWTLLGIVLLGVGLRVPLWFGGAIPGEDYNRYLWDGAVVAHNLEAYKYSPQQLLQGTGEAAYDDLARQGQSTLERNCSDFVHLRTPYPPIALILFGSAHLIAPFQEVGLRVAFAACDALAAGLVLLGLRRLRASPNYLCAYLWCPLLVFETYLRLHYDVLLAMLIVALVLALAWRRAAASGALLAAAVGAKLWPALLGLFLVRSQWRRWRQLIVALLVAAILCGAIAGVYVQGCGQAATSGISAYSKLNSINSSVHYWQVNALMAGGLQWAQANGIAKTTLMALAALAAMALALSGRWELDSIATRVGLGIVIFQLLSAVYWPWYAAVLVPLAALTRRPVFLVYPVLLPLTYLPEVFQHHPQVDLIHGLVLVMVSWELVRLWAGPKQQGVEQAA